MISTRRPQPRRLAGPFVVALLILALPVTLLADEPADSHKDGRVIIIGDHDDEIIIEMDHVHEIVAEAMSGLDDVMAELEDMQFQMRLGQDNRLDLSYDDTTFELDLDQIMSQVALAVRAGFDNIDTDDWTHAHDRMDGVDEDALRHELDHLKKEMKELRRELRKVRELKAD